MHTLTIQTRFNDADRFGHINNTVYFAYFDLAKMEYFTTLQGGKVDWESFGLVVANVNCNFLAPSFIDEPLAVTTTVETIGNKSLVLLQRLLGADGTVKAECRSTMVNFNIATGATEPVSDLWRERITLYEGRSY